MKLFDLYAALLAAKIVRPELLKCALEGGTAEPSFSTMTLDTEGVSSGILLFRHKYQGRIALEKAHGDLVHVLGFCTAWLRENAPQDDEKAGGEILPWVGDPVDDRLSDIDLRFEFEEAITYIAAEGGYTGKDKITWDGQDWKRADPTPDIAAGLSGIVGFTDD